ncbi:hypothetical protein CAB17_00615 [Legionella sainthelensi]|uniref:Uncharacterized protein n=1 Tax=Legionella sainthelensi TaxID=28087 RepID=A0A2H5FGQ2_9GAMM|nr:hypothetical protein CAB17_00615 [Legionella sainthelensi]
MFHYLSNLHQIGCDYIKISILVKLSGNRLGFYGNPLRFYACVDSLLILSYNGFLFCLNCYSYAPETIEISGF